MERTPRITTTSADGVHSRRGADLQTEVRLSFAADHRDGRPFRIDRPVVCPSYRGNGARPAPLLNRVRTASATSTSTDITTAWDSVKPAASAPVPVASSNSSWPSTYLYMWCLLGSSKTSSCTPEPEPEAPEMVGWHAPGSPIRRLHQPRTPRRSSARRPLAAAST